MFDGESELIVGLSEVEVRVAPCVQVSGAAQVLTGELSVGLSGVVDEEDGQRMAALEGAQVSQQSGDLSGRVFVASVQPHEGVEDKQTRSMLVDGLHEALAIVFEIEAQLLGEDEEDGQGVKVDAPCLGQSTKSGVGGTCEPASASFGAPRFHEDLRRRMKAER